MPAKEMTRKELLATIDRAAREGWTELDLPFRGITHLPAKIGQLTNLQALDLSGNRLTSLPDSIGQLANLQRLNLSRNGLKSLPESIGQLAALEKLWLRDNGLEALPESIGLLTNLQTLSVYSNPLTSLPESIGRLTNLRILDLRGGRLTSLPESIRELANLQALRLHRNELKSLPESIGKLANLQELDLRMGQLTSLPDSIGQLTNLQSLDLYRNELPALPESIGQLAKLQTLDISINRLTALPASIGQLSNLQELDLSENGLTSLPESIGQLAKLQTLCLHRNRLTPLPDFIGQLSNLQELDLSDNRLTSLPESIGQLTNLQTLCLQGTRLTSLPESIGLLTKLQALNLGSLRLTSLPDFIGQLTSMQTLCLHGLRLIALPESIGQLANLVTLELRNSELAALPESIGQLANLKTLDLRENQLAALPESIGQLANLKTLDLRENQLTSLPDSIGQLTNLQRLDLNGNQLTALPESVGQLTNLQELRFFDNRLKSLPKSIGQLTNLQTLEGDLNWLTSLPESIGRLANLKTFELSMNQLTFLPEHIGQLTNLQTLHVSGNLLASLPESIGQLSHLQTLSLGDNRLTAILGSIGQLAVLETLMLNGNQLASLPESIGQLAALRVLRLQYNQLTSLPEAIGDLASLDTLKLSQNQLTSLPTSLGKLKNLRELELARNPLTSPPPHIVEQGTQAVLAYLRERLEASRQQWVSKLLVVGEGGVGKTALLRSLRGEPFDPQLSSTHGIQIDTLELAHPSEEDVTMELNAWDFGGQEIYHATHQFFLTNRSLFLLAWNARHGYEQGKLYYWLDAIQARAPESPIILVATHLDQRDADLPLVELRKKYPQIAAHCEISNQTGQGIKELRAALIKSAAGLPLMGQMWPADWLDAAEKIRGREEKHVTPKVLTKIMAAHGVTGYDAEVLARWLHELGDILYFQDDEELNDLVVLKPQWVTEYISNVLESEEVIGKLGIFTRDHMAQLWSDLDRGMRDHFLRLMERFDLSYRTLEDREISLVVERLPLDPPAELEARWAAAADVEPCQEIAIKYRLNTIPAGIPTWFIARSHRFTTHTHWRNGALFAYTPEHRHLALARALPHDRYLELLVRGPAPQNFFALLKDGIEVTLGRFPGLKIDRMIPCPGHNGQPCSHEFRYEQLERRLAMIPPRYEVECPEALEPLDVRTLLFGLEASTLDDVLQEVREARKEDAERHDELLALLQREFAKDFEREQSKIESHCPNTFVLRPLEMSTWRRLMRGGKMELQLYCQYPGRWHPTALGGKYPVPDPEDFMVSMAPYLQRLIKLLKFVTPIAGAWVGVADEAYAELIKNDIKLMTELAKGLPETVLRPGAMEAAVAGERLEPERISGAPLRALRKLLDEVDPQHKWGGLQKVLTPEGHYLWLCEYHAREYAL